MSTPRRRVITVEGGAAPVLHRQGRAMINLASNHGLGLAMDPRVIDAATRALHAHGAGAGASSVITGWSPPVAALAEAVAHFFDVEAALILPTGFAANLAALGGLLGTGDHVMVDARSHASLLDGAALSGARRRTYRHGDVTHLASRLDRVANEPGRRAIVTDGIFSMDGTLAPMAELTELAQRTGSLLIVDEAHATGVAGPTGRGSAEGRSLAAPAELLRVGTLSKSIGAQGGFIAGARATIDHIITHGRAFLFSTALAPASAAAAAAVLEILSTEPAHRLRLHAITARLRTALRDQGWSVQHDDHAPMLAVIVGGDDAAVRLSEKLADRGVFVPAIRPPTVRRGTARLRVAPMACHSDAQIDAVIDAFAACAPAGAAS